MLTGISYHTLKYGLQRPAAIEPRAQSPRYAVQEIDAWLADAARNFETPPRLADLISGELELVDIKEAATLVPQNKRVIYRRAQQGKVAWLKLSDGIVRYSKASVLKLNVKPSFYTTAEVCRILCVRKWHTVNTKFVKTGMLQTTTHPDRPGWPVVTPQALIAFLPHLLPDGSPVDWIDDRLADPHPPLHVHAAAAYLNKPIPHMYELARSGTLPFIWGPSKTERVFPIDSLMFQLEQEPIALRTVAHAFGVSPSAVAYWKQQGLLTCTAHHHDAPEAIPDWDDPERSAHRPFTYRACLLALIGAHLSPGMEPGGWLHARERTNHGLVTTPAAAAALGMSPARLIAAAKSGEIGGIRSPASSTKWNFSPHRIERYKRKLGSQHK